MGLDTDHSKAGTGFTLQPAPGFIRRGVLELLFANGREVGGEEGRGKAGAIQWGSGAGGRKGVPPDKDL